jgi:mannose/fructose/N-acetylgalactosamine-specific phosphotransferase system component IIB
MRGDRRDRGRAVSLVLYRVDDRLIHGQVVVGWGQALNLGFIVLVDDAVAKSDWERELYRMGVPREMEVYFHSAAEAAADLARYRKDPRPGILLTADVDTMRTLAAGGGISAVNVGGIHHRADRSRRLRYVFLSPAEEGTLRDMAAHGIAVTAQDVPSARAVPLDEVLNGHVSP